MFGVRAGGAFDGEQVVPGGALVLFDGFAGQAGMTIEQMMEMRKCRVGQIHAAGGCTSCPARTAASPRPIRTACCLYRWPSLPKAA